MRPSPLSRAPRRARSRTLPAVVLALGLAACADDPVAPGARGPAPAPLAPASLAILPGVLEELRPLAVGEVAQVFDVADGGAAVGSSAANAPFDLSGVYWPAGATAPVHLGGVDDRIDPIVVARGISDNGRWIVGEQLLDGQWTIIRWDGTRQRPRVLMPDWLEDYQARAIDVDDDGNVLAQYNAGSGSRGFLYRNGEFRVVVGHAGGRSFPTDFSGGLVVGYDDDPFTAPNLDLGYIDNFVVSTKLSPDGSWSRAFGINRNGVVVGQAMRGDHFLTHPAVWKNGALTATLRTALGHAVDVNEQDDILLQLADGPYVFREGAGQRALARVPGYAAAPNVVALSNDAFVVGNVSDASQPSRALRWLPPVVAPPNGAPVANAGGPYAAIVEGGSITFAGSASDPDGDALTYTWDFADGALAVGASVPHQFHDDGTYDVKLIVRDAKGAADTASVVVTVRNAAPAITGLKLDPAVLNRPRVGQPLPITFVWSDRGTRDALWAYTITWGDGVVETGRLYDMKPLALTHVYKTPGVRSVRLTITDKDGASVARSIPVDVQP